MTINLEELFSLFENQTAGNQKRISIVSPLGVFFGYSIEGYLRLSFMSRVVAPHLESTKSIRVSQGEESLDVYWTCFDLMQDHARKVFLAFGSNMIEAISNASDERAALIQLKKRYLVWKTMFKSNTQRQFSKEIIQGMFGELFFLKNYLAARYDMRSAILSWSGPTSASKDFAFDNEWYEVKTVGATTALVHISSVAQLSSNTDGHLVVVRVEPMSSQYHNGESCINDLIRAIMSIACDEGIESLFLQKIAASGFDFTDDALSTAFAVKSMTRFLVGDGFPRLTEKDAEKNGICEISYSLIINALRPFEEE